MPGDGQPSSRPAAEEAQRAQEGEGEEEPECRICRCTAAESGEALFSPCQCRGSLKWVHPSCLEQWRASSRNPTSRIRCDMCRAPFQLEQENAKCADIAQPFCHRLGQFAVAVVVAELLTLSCGYLVNAFAVMTGVGRQATFWPGWDLHLHGFTLLLPEVAVLSITRRYRANYLAIKESNPAFEGPCICRLLFEYCSERACYVSIFVSTLVVLIPLGYLGKLIVWAVASDDFGSGAKMVDEDSTLSAVSQLTWGLDPDHFYIASLVFCLAAFVAYLVSVAILVAQRNPHRRSLLKVVAAFVIFELMIIGSGYFVKLLGVATGAYDLHPEQTSSNEIIASALSSVGSGSGTEDSKNSRSVVADGNDGNEEIDWLPGWHHHIVALTAFMPVAHAVFFLHRFRLNYPNWARNHPWFPGINGWLRGPLQEWSALKAYLVTVVATVILVHVFGYVGKIILWFLSSKEDLGNHTDGTDAEGEPLLEYGWAIDYTHYFLGFIMLNTVALALGAACTLYIRYLALRHQRAGAGHVVGERASLENHELDDVARP